MDPLQRLQQTKQQAYQQTEPVQQQVFNRVNRLKQMLPMLRASGKAGMKRMADKIEGFIAPLEGAFRISQRFGNVSDLYKGVTPGSRHQGVDFATPVGTPVRAPVSGRIQRGFDPSGYGDYVKVMSPDGLTYQFSHLSEVAPMQQEIRAGDVIGATGGLGARKGRSTGAHLDIGVQRDGKWIDPMSLEPMRRAYGG